MLFESIAQSTGLLYSLCPLCRMPPGKTPATVSQAFETGKEVNEHPSSGPPLLLSPG